MSFYLSYVILVKYNFNIGKLLKVFYKRVIAPFKGELEMWYQENYSFLLDVKLIFITAWVVLFPTSKIYQKFLKDLPKRNF